MTPKMFGFGILALVVLAAALYFNSGYFNRQLAVVKGFTRECVDGVVYLQFPSGVTVKYLPNGQIATCE